MAFQVDPDHLVPFFLGQVEDHPVTQDAGHVDDDVQLAELLEGGLHEPFAGRDVADVAAVRDGPAARRGALRGIVRAACRDAGQDGVGRCMCLQGRWAWGAQGVHGGGPGDARGCDPGEGLL